jgi:uncharacterized protein YjbJ (UPF0337 family)
MAHGNVADRPGGVVPARRRGLGLLALAPVVARRLFSMATKESVVKASSKDEVAGKIHEVKGAVKQKVGKLTKNADLEAEGIVEELTGRVQKKIGQVKKVLGQ